MKERQSATGPAGAEWEVETRGGRGRDGPVDDDDDGNKGDDGADDDDDTGGGCGW